LGLDCGSFQKVSGAIKFAKETVDFVAKFVVIPTGPFDKEEPLIGQPI
jgi:hypothetical protein